MAILEPAQLSDVSRLYNMSYGDAYLETDRRLLAILDLSPHAVMTQGVASNLNFGHPGILAGTTELPGSFAARCVVFRDVLLGPAV